MRRGLFQLVVLGSAAIGLLASAGGALASACPNESLRAELHSAALPDCRAYELVSPAVKYGWPIRMTRVSSSGEGAIVESLGGFSGSDQRRLLNYYKIMRDEHAGWVTAPLNTPTGYTEVTAGATLLAGSPDLGLGLSEYRRPAAVDPRDTAFYVRGLPGGPPTEVGPLFSSGALESTPGSISLSSSASGPSVSSDLSHVLFMLTGPRYIRGEFVEAIWPGDTTEPKSEGTSQGWDSLYVYTGADSSTPSLVGVDGEGHLIGECGTALGFPAGGSFTSLQGGELYNAVSAPGGSRVFFTVASGTIPGGGCENGGVGPKVNELWAREESSPGVRRSVAISEPTTGIGGDCSTCEINSPQPATFQGASEDGSKVFFLSEQRLLPGAEGDNLYEYNFHPEAEGRKVDERVSLVAPRMAPSGGVVRVSQDGSRVYLVSEGKLAGNLDAKGEEAKAGADNLYVYDTKTAVMSFVGALAEGDSGVWQVRDERPADASPNGRFLVFTSSAQLTPGDTSSLPQVFEYDALARTLVEVSGAQGGPGGEFAAGIVSPRYTEAVNPAPQPSSVSDGGSYVAFQSEAALVPQAILGYRNVYEYHGGRVSLISDGQDRSFREGNIPSVSLVGMDGSGRNIFFTTADRLVPQDGDTQEDVYDARIGGGFVPAPAAVCEGDGCQGPLAPSQSFAAAGSLSQPAGEQVVEAPVVKPAVKARAKARRCKKGTTLRRGRCVRLKAKRSSHRGGSR